MNSCNLQIILGISVGAMGGALLRWWLAMKFNGSYEYLYFGTFLANCLACFIMGFFLNGPFFDTFPPAVKFAVFTGFLGSLSTFSTFVAEVHSSALAREWFAMAINFNCQLVFGFITFQSGRMLGLLINAKY